MGLIVIPAAELTGFPREFFTRLSAEQGAGLGEVVPWDIEAYKLVAMDCVLEAGADVLLYTWVSEPLVRDGRVEGAVIENKSGGRRSSPRWSSTRPATATSRRAPASPSSRAAKRTAPCDRRR